ncbi:MAG: mannitol dehydrogenase family protein, partial [Burkholderiales bacterium]|nr:mannitol dehydrogenase family protein [Burkholderiales bacterium]
MVDRITPRPTDDVIARVKKATGVDDNAALMSETFIQWVIEDKFINGRPELEKVGVDIVDDVQPWEEAKIRILNATHSCVAWAGTLTGYSYIDDSIRVDAINKLAYNYITDDVIPALMPSPLDLHKYRDIILSRFSNPYIKDTNQRVTADSLSKLPGFIVPTLIDIYNRGAVPKSTSILPALYFVFLNKWHVNQLPYEYQDSLLNVNEMHSLLDSDNSLLAFCQDRILFGELAKKNDFYNLMIESINDIEAWITKNTK